MISVATLLVLLMGMVSLAVNDRLTRLLLRETQAKGLAIAHSIGATTTSALLNYDYVSLNQAAQKAVAEGGIAYVIVLDKEGRVAAHSERPDLVGMGLAPETAPARTDGRRPRPVLRNTMVGSDAEPIRALDVSFPVFLQDSDVQWGTVRIGLDLEPMHREVTRVRFILLIIGGVGVLMAIGGARLISRRITGSIEDLVRGTIQVSRGNLDHRIEIDTGDEIATLAEHFNHMTAQVKRQQTEIAEAKGELEVLNATLEEKVAKRTQEFLASEEKYRILVDSSPDAIVIAQGGVLRFMNPAFEEMFGYCMADASRSGLRTEDFFHPEDRERAARTLDALMNDEPVETEEFRGVTRNGEPRLFELRGMRIHYLGAPAVELILLDTTQKKELQDQLLQHEKLRALGELASGVAHDFNNILGIILGRAQLMQKNQPDDTLLRGLRTIERAALDGGETVRRIQDFARSRTQRDFDDIDVKGLLEEVVEITRTRWRDQAQARNVKIDVELDLHDVRNIRGNGSELREVCTNLIFNSVDAMPSGGRIFVSCRMEGDDVVVVVRDDGRGMDESVRARVFDPFFTTKGTKGMGLGMSVAYGIVERHGGRISVESALGHGTTFTIRLPSAAPQDGVPEEDVPSAVETSARILCIDDEHDILELLEDILDAGGFVAETRSNGPDGLRALEARPFDLLFCDLGMKEMSGWEVVSAVRAKDPAIGIVLLTGWGATLSEEKVAEYGIDAVLSKPFEMKKILQTIPDVLALRRERLGSPARPT